MYTKGFGSRSIGELNKMCIYERNKIIKSTYHGSCRDSWDKIIAKYAYHIYEQRIESGIEGDETSDWYKGIELYYSDLCDYMTKDIAKSFDREIMRTIEEIQKSKIIQQE